MVESKAQREAGLKHVNLQKACLFYIQANEISDQELREILEEENLEAEANTNYYRECF